MQHAMIARAKPRAMWHAVIMMHSKASLRLNKQVLKPLMTGMVQIVTHMQDTSARAKARPKLAWPCNIATVSDMHMHTAPCKPVLCATVPCHASTY